MEYPCILNEDNGTWFARFPDLGCVTCADSCEEALIAAHKALCYWLSFGDNPPPSTALETAAQLWDIDDSVVMIAV